MANNNRFPENTTTTHVPAGTNQATAVELHPSAVDYHAPAVPAGTGVRLPAANAGDIFFYTNGDASNILLVYPPIGSAFNGLATNAPVSLKPNSAAIFKFDSPTIIKALFNSDVTVLAYSQLSSKAADAQVARFVAPYNCTILRIDTVLNNALATGNATVTAAINGTGVTGGVVTCTQSGSAAGNVATATPSALNVATAGQQITLTVAGASTATGTLNAQILIARN